MKHGTMVTEFQTSLARYLATPPRLCQPNSTIGLNQFKLLAGVGSEGDTWFYRILLWREQVKQWSIHHTALHSSDNNKLTVSGILKSAHNYLLSLNYS